MHKIGQSRRFLGRLLEPLLKSDFPLTKNVLKPLAKSFLIPLGVTAAASATDAVIQKKDFSNPDLAKWTTWIILNGEMNDIMEVIKSLESGLLIKGVN